MNLNNPITYDFADNILNADGVEEGIEIRLRDDSRYLIDLTFPSQHEKEEPIDMLAEMSIRSNGFLKMLAYSTHGGLVEIMINMRYVVMVQKVTMMRDLG